MNFTSSARFSTTGNPEFINTLQSSLRSRIQLNVGPEDDFTVTMILPQSDVLKKPI